jgi:hypothetical protein
VKRGTLRSTAPVSGSKIDRLSMSPSNSSMRSASISLSAGKTSMTSPRTR